MKDFLQSVSILYIVYLITCSCVTMIVITCVSSYLTVHFDPHWNLFSSSSSLITSTLAPSGVLFSLMNCGWIVFSSVSSWIMHSWWYQCLVWLSVHSLTLWRPVGHCCFSGAEGDMLQWCNSPFRCPRTAERLPPVSPLSQKLMFYLCSRHHWRLGLDLKDFPWFE